MLRENKIGKQTRLQRTYFSSYTCETLYVHLL